VKRRIKPYTHGDCLNAQRYLATIEALESKLREAEHWQREHDSAIDAVVQACLDSRGYPPDRQAAYLRDQLLSQFDPLMMVTQRLRESAALQSAQKEPAK
jgi:hypothetical protein